MAIWTNGGYKMVKKEKVKPIDPSSAKDYFIKATDFFEIMEISYSEGRWNAVGLNAVHCAISSSDSLLAKNGGIRNISQDHKEAADILIKTVKGPDVKLHADKLRKILGLKNLIAYERRLFTETDATNIIKPTRSFYKWTANQLG